MTKYRIQIEGKPKNFADPELILQCLTAGTFHNLNTIINSITLLILYTIIIKSL